MGRQAVAIPLLPQAADTAALLVVAAVDSADLHLVADSARLRAADSAGARRASGQRAASLLRADR